MSVKRGRKPIQGPRDLFEHTSPDFDGNGERTRCTLCDEDVHPEDWGRVGNLRRHVDDCAKATPTQKSAYGSTAAVSKRKKAKPPKAAPSTPRSEATTAQRTLHFEPYKEYTTADEFLANCLQAKWKAAANIPYNAFNHPLFSEMIQAYSRGASKGASGDSTCRTFMPKVHRGALCPALIAID